MPKRVSRYVLICVTLMLGVTLAAKVKIERIEYNKADGFAQLFLPTNQILPIPESIYPDPGNRLKVVMRIKDAECNFSADSLKFDSPVIQSLKVANGPSYCDIEISLKKESSHRLFSDQQGVYIEFPVESQPEQAAHSLPAVTAPVASTLDTALAGGPVALKDIRVTQSDNERVKFELVLSGKTSYQLIPIPTAPVRLAIDLKNTRAKSIHKTVNLHNVKTVRGARNSDFVYRVVFDLEKLGNYRVEMVKNILCVEFSSGVLKQGPAQTNIQGEPAAVQPKAQNLAQSGETTPGEKPGDAAKESGAPPPVLNLQPAIDRMEAPKTAAKPKEFFGAEKAKASEEKLNAGTGVVTMQDEQGNEKTTFLTTTIEEGRPKFSGEPYDFIFKDTDLIDVLKFIARTAGLNMAFDPDVSGKVTCEFVQVPWDQALDLFLKINGLDFVMEGNVLRIGRVEKLASEAEKRRKLKEARNQEVALTVATRTLSFAKASKLKPILDKQLTPRGEIIIDERTNMLIISEVPDRIKVLDQLIETLDTANPQVQIEARIVEATTDFLNSFGIQWGYNMYADPSYGTQTNLVFPNKILASGYTQGNSPNKYTINGVDYGFALNTPTADTAMYPALRLGNILGNFQLDVFLSGMERRGKGRVISSPKTTTQNNMRATILQGERIPIQTIQNNTITTQYIVAGLAMTVIPQITARGAVVMEIDIVNDVANFEKNVMNMPTINAEAVSSTVMVNDGATIVIGGMYKLAQSSTTTGVPLLSRIPLIGGLFRSQRKSNEQRELLVFLTPRIIK